MLASLDLPFAFSYIAHQITGMIFRKSLRISGRAKLEHNIGQITTMISTDASRLDSFTGSGHMYVPHLTWQLISESERSLVSGPIQVGC